MQRLDSRCAMHGAVGHGSHLITASLAKQLPAPRPADEHERNTYRPEDSATEAWRTRTGSTAVREGCKQAELDQISPIAASMKRPTPPSQIEARPNPKSRKGRSSRERKFSFFCSAASFGRRLAPACAWQMTRSLQTRPLAGKLCRCRRAAGCSSGRSEDLIDCKPKTVPRPSCARLGCGGDLCIF